MGISATNRVETVHDVQILTPFNFQTFAIADQFMYKVVLAPEKPVQQFTIAEDNLTQVMLYDNIKTDVHTIAEELLLRVIMSGAVYRGDTDSVPSAYGQIPYGTTAYGVGLIYLVSSTLTASAQTHRIIE